MNLFDIFVVYLYGLKYVLVVVMAIIAVFSIDDLFIDLVYWWRRIYRYATVYKKNPRTVANQLFTKDEQPLAVMVPAWQEHGVIGKMAELAASRLDYENYQIFIGTYPNDPQTQQDVDEVCSMYPHVHKVVCSRPGPTSKADCLNNIVASIIQFEKKAKVEFSGYILHDSEDMISALELRLFNYLLPQKDLIQLPVYPYIHHWHYFTQNHYADEFAEMHSKDVVVREALAGQVPSAGVGTCFSRRAVLRLLVEGDGVAFDIRSLTEDYDIGFRLKQWGMSEIFVRFPVVDLNHETLREKARGVSQSEGNVICVREFFPDTVSAAIRQKCRWIIGIVFQGFSTHKWTDDLAVNYFLWRDRRGFFNNAIGFIAVLLLAQLIGLEMYHLLVPDSYNFLELFMDSTVVLILAGMNTFFFFNRVLHRFYFVSQYYGYFQGLLSFFRIFWGAGINFFANLRAIRQALNVGNLNRLNWDKTTHEFPFVETTARKTPLGAVLLKEQAISELALEQAILTKPDYQLLGGYLVQCGLISNEVMSRAVARQSRAEFIDCDPFQISESVLALVPKDLAVKYAVLPLFVDENEVLVLGREQALSPVAVASIQRWLKRPVRWGITRTGAVTLGIRYWYFGDQSANPDDELAEAVANKQISQWAAEKIKDKFFATRCQLGACLVSAKLLDTAVLNQAILAYAKVKETNIGDFLVSSGYLTQAELERGIYLQKKQQLSIAELISRELKQS
ncbi:bacteriophage N4 adsorption protein B [Vibrio aerogenes CECT 7868]|uniref:Bacteriophage N4 adsorption protein B n=1 Tax=Vibrio aerogenes CECT 7868 TaxID=1216006 RepID=A0A1M5UI69_9VIBR|nr:glycosyl transferase family protein [Vibrio aerogenes]SHH62611.1 bacteriophage N4 adsorption protein B [Vibrio aerogenes CECT 7868]